MKKLTWGDLFKYVTKKVNFHEKVKGDSSTTTWTCKGGDDKTFVKEFCEEHHISFPIVSNFLELCGGYCDCEVLFNAKNQLKEKDPIGKMSIDWSNGILNVYPNYKRGDLPHVILKKKKK